MALRLNSLKSELFTYDKNKATDVIRLNANGDNDSERVLNRDQIIAACRLATVEYLGRQVNSNSNATEKYTSRLNGKSYGDFQKNTMADVVLFCANAARRAACAPMYTNIDQVKMDRTLYTNAVFYNALVTLASEVITPLYPAAMDIATNRLITWDTTPFGQSKVIDIKSNDFFVFQDDSWGAVSSKPYNYLYRDQVVLTPKPYSAKAKIKWYQDVVSGDAGDYFAAMLLGARSKMYAITIEQFKAAIANTKYMPSGFTLDSYSAENWNKAIMQASAVNGVSRNQLMAYGTLAGLSNILPTVGTPAAAAGIQGMIGEEWVRNGFLANVAGVDLVEAGLAVVPGTQNYNPQFISLDDADQENVYIFSKLGYAPMAGAIMEGTPIDIVYTPEQTADMSIDIAMTITCDVKPVFSSKVFKIEV